MEDARGARPPAALVEIARGADPVVRSWAVRGLGRIGDPALAGRVEPFLRDPEPRVRVEAGHALAALRPPGDEGGHVWSVLREAVEDPAEDAGTRAELAFALARSARGATELAAVDTLLREVAGEPAVRGGGPGGAALRETLARAWELRARRSAEGWSDGLAAGVLSRLYEDAGDGGSWSDVRTRRLSVAALRARGALPADLLEAALDDPDPGVRRQAVAALGPDATLADGEDRLLVRLDDPDATVRIEALGRYDAWLRPVRGCGPVRAAVEDGHPHVALVALDLLAGPCPDTAAQRITLMEAADAGVPASGDWHRPVHALVALAAVAPEEARHRLPGATGYPSPFARARAAEAAVRLSDGSLLRSLADDPDPNVRTPALVGLGEIEGHGADSVYRAQLASTDAQLVLTAVGLLEGTPDPEPAAAAVAAALSRFGSTGKETVRDVRMALLDALEAFGKVEPETLRPLVRDYDPVVAARAAELVQSVVDEPVEPDPRPLPPLAAPGAAELETLGRTTVTLEMARGGEIAIRLLPDQAATNAARFARLAGEGWFDGLTFHRVVPNFVIQGGSPGANEYSGADLYTRDELGRAGHWAGTVGLSTRGRDTGDAQLFINLVDNPRLDFAYTVFGEVVRGLDVARGVLEGDVIVRARVEERLP